MNGTPGDHPLNDIIVYGLPTYSLEIDELIRQIAKFVPQYRLEEMFDWFSPPAFPEFQDHLQVTLERLKQDAKERGWEAEE